MSDLIRQLREAALQASCMNQSVARTTLYSLAADALEEANGLNVTMQGFYEPAMDRAETAEAEEAERERLIAQLRQCIKEINEMTRWIDRFQAIDEERSL